jgi:pimeloyl-ACP methyl ester carboxylesterase
MIFAKKYGSGERLFLCFHGWGGNHREFALLASRAPDGVCLLSLDLPGYGLSPRPEVWSPDAVSDEIIEMLKARDIDSCGLIGFCSGADLALIFAARTPETVKRIVMIDPFAFVPWYFRLFLYSVFGRIFYGLTFRTETGRKITDRVIKRLQSSKADFTNSFVNLDHDVILRYLRMLSRTDTGILQEKLKMEIDILYGENSFSAVRRSVEIFRNLLPQAKVRELKGVGHLPMIEDANQLAAYIFEDTQADTAASESMGTKQGKG